MEGSKVADLALIHSLLPQVEMSVVSAVKDKV
jgi:hypothetical protein